MKMSRNKGRSEKRAARREAFRRSAGAKTVVDGARKSRARRAGSWLHRAMVLGAFAIVVPTVLLARPTRVMAGFVDAPEIDPGSMAGAMTLLVGGVLTLTGRVRHA